jgi:hybrid cluster-associated redox disulfide protein
VVDSLPTSEMTVAEILESWPETVSVFQDFKTACVGCVMAPFDTMIDVARIYELELSEIMEALYRVVKTAGQAGEPATD